MYCRIWVIVMATTVETYPLERNKIKKKFLSGMLGWLVLTIIVSFLASYVIKTAAVVLFLVLAVLFAIWEWFYQTRYFQAYFYDVGEHFLVIRKDWITPRETTLPYEKLQDVYMDQDLLDRVFGLWDVHVSTATMMSGMEAHIDGVSAQNAGKVRELIMGKIREKGKRVTGYD